MISHPVVLSSSPNARLGRIITQHRHTILLFLGLMTFSLAIFLLYWIAFYPGLMNNDSFWQWSQISGKYPLSNEHPYLQTLWFGLLSLGFNTIAPITLLQAITTSIICAALATWLIAQKVRVWLVILAHIAISLAPPVGISNVTLIKDTTAGQFTLLLILGWLLVMTRPPQVNRRGILAILALAVITAVDAYMRHNNIVLVPLMLGLVIFIAPFERRLKIIYTAAVIFLVVLIEIPLLTGAVQPPPPDFIDIGKLPMLVFSYQNNSYSLSADDRAYLASLINPNNLSISICNDIGPLVMVNYPNSFTDKFWHDPEVHDRLTKMLINTLINDPGLLLSQRVCYIATQLGLPAHWQGNTWQKPGYTPDQEYDTAGFPQLKPQPLSHRIQNFLLSVLQKTEERPWYYWFWNHFVGLGLVMLCGLIAVYRHDGRLFGVAGIVFAIFLSIFAMAVVPDFRYLYPMYLFSFYAIPFICLPRKVLPSLPPEQST